MDMDTSRDDGGPSPLPERQRYVDMGTIRAEGIVSEVVSATAGAPGIDLSSDTHIIINDEGGVPGVGVEDGIISFETNDDFAMGAPPGASGAPDSPSPPAARLPTDTLASATPVRTRRTSP